MNMALYDENDDDDDDAEAGCSQRFINKHLLSALIGHVYAQLKTCIHITNNDSFLYIATN